ncbi:MAG: hypothetical protein KAS32_02230 [Candidatus Peribacteraceae bacterium]|nr:hypothetical protein [Candidatus Peribacteraceae bacterium]
MSQYPEAQILINKLQELVTPWEYNVVSSIAEKIHCPMKQEKGCDLEECMYHRFTTPTLTTREDQCLFQNLTTMDIIITKKKLVNADEINTTIKELRTFVALHVPRYKGRTKCTLSDITIDPKTSIVSLTWRTPKSMFDIIEQVHIKPTVLTDKQPTILTHIMETW